MLQVRHSGSKIEQSLQYAGDLPKVKKLKVNEECTVDDSTTTPQPQINLTINQVLKHHRLKLTKCFLVVPGATN